MHSELFKSMRNLENEQQGESLILHGQLTALHFEQLNLMLNSSSIGFLPILGTNRSSTSSYPYKVGSSCSYAGVKKTSHLVRNIEKSKNVQSCFMTKGGLKS